MSERVGVVVIGDDTAFKGTLRNCKRLEIYGLVDGNVTADELIVHAGGNFFGEAKSTSAEISGSLQGDIVIDGLIRIHPTGVVGGNVHYGRLAMEPGAHLSADVRNVPPRLMGDFNIAVVRGRSARITASDITAVDPDDKATDLIFTVTNETHGSVRVTGSTANPAGQFNQAELIGGRVIFQHSGAAADTASFDVQITDKSGSKSGAPQTVTVTVRTI